MQWINCSNRLPERKDGDSCGDVVCRRLESGKWSLFLEYCEDAKDYADQWLEGACEVSSLISEKDESK